MAKRAMRLNGTEADETFMGGAFGTSVCSAEVDRARRPVYRLGGSLTRRTVHVYPCKLIARRWLIVVRRDQTEREYHRDGIKGGVPLAGVIIEERSLKQAAARGIDEMLRLAPKPAPKRRKK